MDQCDGCKYWVERKINTLCRRYPDYQIHASTDWCGEFAPIEVQDKPIADYQPFLMPDPTDTPPWEEIASPEEKKAVSRTIKKSRKRNG